MSNTSFPYPIKYYCDDIGLRNACTGFRKQEMPYIMENILYNELRVRGCEVDIGVVCGRHRRGKHDQKLKVKLNFFIYNLKLNMKYYIIF